MTWEFHPAKADFSTYAEEWDRLNVQLFDGHPFFDSRFVGPLLEHFASGKEQLCICRSNGVISGLLILEQIGFGRWASFRPSQAQVTSILIADASTLSELLTDLPGFAWTIEFLAIDPRYSPDLSRSALARTVSSHVRTIAIERGISFSDYWNRRSKNLRANIRRYLNRAKREAGLPEFSIRANSAEMTSSVRRFGELESAGWKGAAGTAVAIENKQGAFYGDVLSRFALTNQAEVCELSIGNQLAASRLLISNRQIIVILKTTYSESLARFAPSRLLLYRLLEDCLASQSTKAIEFYTNATIEQAEWSTSDSMIQNVQVFKSNFIAAGHRFLRLILGALRGSTRRSKTSGVTRAGAASSDREPSPTLRPPRGRTIEIPLEDRSR